MSTTNASTETSSSVQDTFITETITRTISPITYTTYTRESTIITLDSGISPTTYTTRTRESTTITFNGTTTFTYTTTYLPPEVSSTGNADSSASSAASSVLSAASSASSSGGSGSGTSGSGLADFTDGERVGMVVGGLLGGLIVLALIWFMIRKRRRGAVRLPTSEPKPLSEPDESQTFNAKPKLLSETNEFQIFEAEPKLVFYDEQTTTKQQSRSHLASPLPRVVPHD